MKKLLIATKNSHKLEEFNHIFGNEYQVLSLFDFPQIPEIEETGHTFSENSSLKAITLFEYIHEATIADDSGLVVEALDGAPGIYSARFSGRGATDEKNRTLLLHKLKDVTHRRAYFECCIAFKDIDHEKSFHGRLYGSIAHEEKGVNGFGYDSIFIPDGYEKTLAEFSDSEKNKISHRFLAIQQLLEWKNEGK